MNLIYTYTYTLLTEKNETNRFRVQQYYSLRFSVLTVFG